MLVSVNLPDSPVSIQDSLDELKSLAQAAGAKVVGYCKQNRRGIHPAYYVGRGKADEIAEWVEKTGANLVIFDNDLSPAQTRDLEEIIDCKVVDRSVLILDIFSSHAQTHEANLQVDLALMQYTYPRLTRMWSHLDTVAGGASSVGAIGTRGTGEKQLEIDRRLVQKRISVLKKQINQIGQRKKRQVKSRKNHFTVGLVGYTNAGKSTLLNALTEVNTFVEDKLFATLDTKTAKWQLNQDHSVLLSDTVGFVRDLPHHLVASFRATLEEAIHADLLLHVVDVSHAQAEHQVKSVNQVLREIGCDDKDTLFILNKTDQPGSQRVLDTWQTIYPEAIAMSAKTGKGIDLLTEAVMIRLTGRHLHLRIAYPASDGRIRNFVRAYGQVLSENYQDSTVVLEAYLGTRQLPGLQYLRPTSYEVISPG